MMDAAALALLAAEVVQQGIPVGWVLGTIAAVGAFAGRAIMWLLTRYSAVQDARLADAKATADNLVPVLTSCLDALRAYAAQAPEVARTTQRLEQLEQRAASLVERAERALQRLERYADGYAADEEDAEG